MTGETSGATNGITSTAGYEADAFKADYHIHVAYMARARNIGVGGGDIAKDKFCVFGVRYCFKKTDCYYKGVYAKIKELGSVLSQATKKDYYYVTGLRDASGFKNAAADGTYKWSTGLIATTAALNDDTVSVWKEQVGSTSTVPQYKKSPFDITAEAGSVFQIAC